MTSKHPGPILDTTPRVPTSAPTKPERDWKIPGAKVQPPQYVEPLARNEFPLPGKSK